MNGQVVQRREQKISFRTTEMARHRPQMNAEKDSASFVLGAGRAHPIVTMSKTVIL